jgi:hypothetical protein
MVDLTRDQHGQVHARLVDLFDTMSVAVTRYRYRGDIPTPWSKLTATD